MKSIQLISLALTMLMCHLSFGQEKTILGIVSDGQNPLPGVSVLIKNSKKGIQTDLDGRYLLKVNAKDTLVIRYVGMKTQEIVVGNQTTIDVKLLEDIKLEETLPYTPHPRKNIERGTVITKEQLEKP
jgi:Ca-activated chloride channel family protein